VSSLDIANEQNESIWSVTLDPVSDEGPFDIHVSQPLQNGTVVTIILHDVLFGDVWVCSGQSNMQFTVNLMFNGSEEIANAGNFSKIRLFSTYLTPSLSPLEELTGSLLNWSVASPQTVGGPAWQYMSAVCWLYGRMVHQALNGRPLGLIVSTWGGTMIEVWMPPKALQDCNTTTDIFDRNEYTEISSYNVSPLPDVPGNHSCLYNSMIYPFTRMVIYGVIWYQGKITKVSFIIYTMIISSL
jgi:sialate O-acetylesterase